MPRVLARVALAALLGVGLAALSAAADDPKTDGKKVDDAKKSDDAKKGDEKKDDAKPATVPAKAPDWSGFASAGEVQGEVVSATDTGFTLRVFYTATSGGSSTRGRSRYVRPPTVTEKHTDYHLTFADEGMVRWRTLPPKGTDEKGKPVPFTEKERADLRRPAGVTGFFAERGDLKVGHLVEVTLVRPKTIHADKAMPQDLRVKYAMIVGTDPKAVPAEPTKPGKGKKAN